MKNYRKKFTLSILGIATLFASCEKQETSNSITEEETNVISQEMLDKVEALSFNTKDAEMIDFMLPDGSYEKRIQVENDISLSIDYINSMELNGGVQSEQYRTNNLVSPGVITVLGFTGGANALTTRNRNGLQLAVDNYNNLNLNISMDLSFGSANFRNFDIVVYRNPNSTGAGGSAGFPRNGRPNQFVQISGLDNASNNLNEHVISHEIGHSIGFRHTDWFSRQSCGDNVNEGTAGVGALQIPGTPRGFDPNSFMLSCFSGNEDGEFGEFDVVALDFLY